VSFGARVDIRLDALRHNLELLHSTQPTSRVLAAVKANAYGHGIVGVARCLEGHVDALAVARLCEAQRLRAAGVKTRIVLMGGVLDEDELRESEAYDCDLVVHESSQVALLERRHNRELPRIWLKVNTGMNRLGVPAEQAPGLLERLRGLRGIRSVGLMTHLANADDIRDPATPRQIERFRALTDGFVGDVSIANSAALLGWNDRVCDPEFWNHRGEIWIRPGISLYGISPLRGRTARELGLRPVMQFESCLIAVHEIAAGERIGYGGTWTADRDTRLGVVAAGYGDGFTRSLPAGTPVLVNGRRATVAGIISMDLTVVDLGPGASDRPGDPVILWGEGLPVEEMAIHAGTVPYTLVCGVIDRTGRVV